MKYRENTYIVGLLILFMLILMLSCSKTEDGDDQCPIGFTGKNCDIQITPDSVIITKINVLRFPATNIQGQNWDADGNPDIFVQVWQNDEYIWSSSRVINNVTNDTNYNFIPTDTLALTDPLTQYAIQLYDKDDDGDDYIGGMNFISYYDNNGFPDLLILDDGGEVAFELNLEYTWAEEF